MSWKSNFKNSAKEFGIYFGQQGEEKEPTIKFAIHGEVLLSVGRQQFLAKGLTPISDSKELYDLMLEFFKMEVPAKGPDEAELKK